MHAQELIDYVVLPKKTVDAVDYLVKLVPHANPLGVIDSEADWKVFGKIVDVWAYHYPADFADFVDNVKVLRNEHSHNKGIAKEGEAMLMHHLELPEKLYKMIMIIYPNQNLDSDFVDGVKKHTPLFYVR